MYKNIHILITETKTNTLCGIEYSLKHGSLNENNMTHMIEHLLASFINKTNCNQSKILDTLHIKNSETNASVTNNYTKVYINGLYIDIMLSSLYYLCFTNKILEIEKKTVIQELKQKINNNNYYYYKINKYLFKDYNETNFN